MRVGRNAAVDFASPDSWNDQTIADVLEDFDLKLWRSLAQEIHRDPQGGLARRTARQAQLCDVTGNGNVWLLLLRRLGVDPELCEIPDRHRELHWP